jgi:threonine aldolase
VVALGCTPAEVTWEAGVDALALGTTKGGTLAAEAMVFFNPAGTQRATTLTLGYYLYSLLSGYYYYI